MPTTNPVPSTDPSDLLFNAGKLDEVVNGAANSFTDRLGVARRTVAGMNADFDAQLEDAESDLNVYRADAAASAAEALGYLQTIRATSYGAYASDPATDPLGNPPTIGDEYFNTTANLLKRWNGTTWQASDINTANLAASSGSSLVGYMPAGTGAVATTVQEALIASSTKLTDHLTFAEALAIQTRISATDFTAKIQQAIDATPSGGTLEINIPGIALIDTLPSVKVESDLGNNWLYGGLIINKPMRVIGNKDFRLKIKDFSTAWAAQASGDSICAVIVNSSNVHIDGWNADCNANKHYELSGVHKWWENGPTLKRPPCGFSVTVARTQANVRDVLIENCSIYNPLAGISFLGNALDTSRAAFLSGSLETGVVKDCVSRNNRVFNARGNGVLFTMGVDNCWSESDVFVDGMYHAIRVYSRAINCGGKNSRSHVNPARIIARYNSTDLGYWRTTDTSSPEFKMVRTGYKVGGADSYNSTYGYSVINSGFDGCVNIHESYTASDDNYFQRSSTALASFTLTGLKKAFAKNCKSYGAYYGISLISDGIAPAEAVGVSVTGNTISESLVGDIVGIGLRNVSVTGNTINVNETISYGSVYLKDFVGGIVADNTFNGTPLAGTYAVLIGGDCTNLKVGENKFSKNFSALRRYAQEAGSTPAIQWPKRTYNLVDANVISGGALSNGWALAYPTPLEAQENQLRVLSDGSLHLRLALSGAAASSNTVATLVSHLRPTVSVGFIAHSVVNGDAYWGRVLTDGRIQINLPAYPTASATEIWVDVIFNTLL